MKQKILNLLLMVIMLISVFSMKTDAAEEKMKTDVQEITAFAGEVAMAANEEIELIDYGYCGNSDVIWGVTENGMLVIGGEGAMPDYEEDWYSTPWFKYRASISTLYVSGTVTSIGEYAFYYMQSLHVAVIESGVKTLGKGAFYDCEYLESVIIEEGLTKIGSSVFYNCYYLNHVEIPDTVTAIGEYAFYDCYRLTEIELPAKLKCIEEGTFVSSGLKSITIPEGVTKIATRAFNGCYYLTSVKLPKTLTVIEKAAFMSCTALTSFTFPNIVKNVPPEIFKGCTNLKSVTIPYGVEGIGSAAFSGCTSLEKISFPETIKTIGNYAFWGCSSLRELVWPEAVSVIKEGTFQNCTKLTRVYLPEKIDAIEKYAFKNCDSLTVFHIPSYVKTIEEEVFGYCDNLKTVRIPASVTSIKYYAFVWCSKLHEVTVLNPDLKFDGAHLIFENDPNLLIRCIENSTAHEFAVRYGHDYEFIDIGIVTEYFDDVYTDWYTDYVQYVYDRKLMNGIQGVSLFRPNANITKAQVAQVIYNMEGQPEVDNKVVFEELNDVYEGEWYASAVAWAYNNNIVTGDLNTRKFAPNADVTREQLALMMYRYAAYKEYDVTVTAELEGMKNAENVSNWAYDGMKWAVGAGLISGIDKGGVKDLAPQGNATRAQMAAILQRFCENIVPVQEEVQI